jgi:exo-1,4-beta-D-glucosaminidase
MTLCTLVTSLLVGAAAATTAELSTGWRLSSSATLSAGSTGAEISKNSFDAASWLKLGHFPTTVLAALASNGSAPRPDFSLPLYYARNINDTKTAQFDVPWWYRAPLPTSATAAVAAGGRAILTFKGVNYRANIWVNGMLLAQSVTTQGAFRYHDIDVTAALSQGGSQPALAVEVFRSYDWGLDCKDYLPDNEQVSCRGKNKTESTDLGITFVDWAPAPHDANLGLWRGVSLQLLDSSKSGATAVTCRYPQVTTWLTNGGNSAQLQVMAEVQNWGGSSASGAFKAQIAGLFSCTSKTLTVGAGKKQLMVITADQCPGLIIRNLTADLLWWPWQMGDANQHNLTTAFDLQQPKHAADYKGFFADAAAVSTSLVGLREMNVTNDRNGNAVVRVNRKQILVRGGGWAPDLLQRSTDWRLAQELRLARDLGLNTIRLEGKLQDDELFEQASALGLLIIPGLCCCDAWQLWPMWSKDTFAVAMDSVRDQGKSYLPSFLDNVAIN